MADVTILPATAAHLEQLAPELRLAHVLECEAVGAVSPRECLARCLASSELAFAGLLGARVAAVFGMGPFRPGVSFVWCMTGQVVDERPRAFWRLCRPVLAQLAEAGGHLVAFTDARHQVALRWLQRLGFAVGPPEPWGVRGMPHCRSVYGSAT